MERDTALDYLLSMHGETVHRDDGYWWKVEAWTVNPTPYIPHGIRYNLTLHDKYNTRVFGMDNAHGITAYAITSPCTINIIRGFLAWITRTE